MNALSAGPTRKAVDAWRPDAIFRIASQTKALTSVAIMALVEQGRLSLDDRVSDYLPTFAKTTVLLAGRDGCGSGATRDHHP